MAVLKRRLPAPLYAAEKKLRTRGVDPRVIAWDDYLIPGLDGEVLRNKVGLKHEPYGCTDKAELRRREERFSAFRINGLKQSPIAGDFSFGHMQAIHREIFQDVYAWAGEVRTVDMAKQDHGFMAHEQIEQLWGKVAGKLQSEDRLQGIQDGGEFADKLAFYWGRVNIIHAFREGNTRAQVVFFDQLTEQAGWHLDVARLAPGHPESVYEEFVEARFHHQDHGFDHAPLARVLGKVLAPVETLEQRLERAAAPSVEHERWAPRPAGTTHAAQKPSSLDSSTDEYENPDKMRTAHRRIGIQENAAMTIDPSKETEQSSFDPQAIWRERQENLAKTDRVADIQQRYGVTLPPSPSLDRQGNSAESLLTKNAANREKAATRVPLPPRAPLPPRPGSRRAVLSLSAPTVDEATPQQSPTTAETGHVTEMRAASTPSDVSVFETPVQPLVVPEGWGEHLLDEEEDTLRVELAADMANDDGKPWVKDEPKKTVWLDERLRRFPELRPESFDPPAPPTGRHRAPEGDGPSL